MTRPFDLVVPVGAPAAQFATRYRARLFSGSPMVLAGGDPRLIPSDYLTTNATYVTHAVKLASQVEDILRLKPDTTNIVVVIGASALERFWRSECQREFASFTNRIHFSWLDDLSLPQIQRRVANLPPRSFILFTLLTMDGAGVPHDYNDALRAVHAAADAPVYGYFASQFGLGTVGGRLYPDATVGVEAARVGARILRGEPAGKIAPKLIESGPPVYDWRELQQWRIQESRLPAGGIVKFRQPTLWDRYKWRILMLTGFCAAQSLLIALLVRNLMKRRRAERSLRESQERLSLAAAAANVGFWMWEPARDEVWATGNWRRMFGFPLSGMIRYRDVMERIHPDDRAAIDQAVQQSLGGGIDCVGEYRAVIPGASQRWLAVRGRLQSEAGSHGCRLLGVTIDITERRQAEEAARELSGRLIAAQEQERARLAKELHDGLSQNLALLAVELDLFGQHPPEAPESVRARIRHFCAQTRSLSGEVHRLAHGLHPAKLEQLGLAAALAGFCREIEAAHQIAASLNARDVPRGLPREVALCLYRVTQEALQNVVKHSGAGRATVDLTARDDAIELAIADDGQGFDVGAARVTHSLGLISMAERVRHVHGQLTVDSKAGQGTRIRVRIPLALQPNP